MSRSETSCPNCGAPIVYSTAVSLMVVCEYCDTTVVRKDLDISSIGKMAKLAPDASPLHLGIEGTDRGRPFTVIGRLQIHHDVGLWNEWFIRYGDSSGPETAWIGEAMGDYMIYWESSSKGGLPDPDDLQPGRPLKLGGRRYTVSDMRLARCVAGEGELPFAVGSGYEFRTVDLRSADHRVATIDYSEAEPTLYEGLWQEFDEFRFDSPREFDGWSS